MQNVSRLRHDRSKATGIWGIKLLLARLNRQREADVWLPGECLVLPILFTEWLFLFGTAVNFPTGFVWQQVTVKKMLSQTSLYFHIFFCSLWFLPLILLHLLHVPHILHFLMSVVLTSLHAQAHSHSPPKSHLMPPEAICQLQLASRGHCAVVT